MKTPLIFGTEKDQISKVLEQSHCPPKDYWYDHQRNLETHNYILEFERFKRSAGPPTGVKLCDLAKISQIFFLAKKLLQNVENHRRTFWYV